jgi:Bifunctional DNA primase/polymerase, N-terminal/AAA domain
LPYPLAPDHGNVTALNGALELARLGFRVVWIHPPDSSCKSPGKQPILKDWVNRASDDPKELEAQWGGELSTQDPNVGIVLGTQPDGRYILAIDVDDAGRLTELETSLGTLPATAAISSARGDKLLYYVVAPPDVLVRLRNVTGLWKVPGIDVKVAGGQVVAPPSRHPSGTKYVWRTQGPTAKLPQKWLEAIVPLSVTGSDLEPRIVPQSPPLGRDDLQLRRARAYVAKMSASVQGQNGSGDAFAVARKCLQDFLLSDADTWQLLNEWNQRCQPPWSTKELAHKLKDARDKARVSRPIQDRPRPNSAPTPTPTPTPPPLESPTEPKALIEFIDHDELYTPDPPADLLVPALGICAGPSTGFFGQSYVGKSIATMAAAMAIALGRELWGQWAVRRGPWAHFDYEQGRRRCKRLVQRLSVGFGVTKDETRDWLRVAVYPVVNLTTKDAVDHYSRAFEGCAVATLDALKGLTPGVDENSSQMRDFMGILRMASENTGCVAIVNHNAGKPPPVGQRARKHEGRGSSGIFDECQTVFVATGEKGLPVLVTHEKDRELGKTVADFALRIVDVEERGDPQAGIGVLVEGVELSELGSQSARRAAKEQERRMVEERKLREQAERKVAREKADLEDRQRRDAGDDGLAVFVRKEKPELTDRQLRAELEKRGSMGKDRAQNAILRTKLVTQCAIDNDRSPDAVR